MDRSYRRASSQALQLPVLASNSMLAAVAAMMQNVVEHQKHQQLATLMRAALQVVGRTRAMTQTASGTSRSTSMLAVVACAVKRRTRVDTQAFLLLLLPWCTVQLRAAPQGLAWCRTESCKSSSQNTCTRCRNAACTHQLYQCILVDLNHLIGCNFVCL